MSDTGQMPPRRNDEANQFSELIDSIRHGKRLFSRQLESSVYAIGEDRLAITRLHDEYHDIYLAMRLTPQRTISKIDARMERIPYPVCFEALAQLQKLEGLYVFERGILKKIRQIIPRAVGCTHLGELIEYTLRTLFARVEEEIHQQQREGLQFDMEEKRQLSITEAVLADTCVAFNRQSADEAILQQAQEKLARKGAGEEIDGRRGA